MSLKILSKIWSTGLLTICLCDLFFTSTYTVTLSGNTCTVIVVTLVMLY